MFTKSLAVALIMTALCAPIATAQTPIERLAPENAVLVVGSRNFQTLADHFKATPLWTLWNDPSMVKLRADAMKQFDEEMTKMFEDLGVEKDSMVAPTGAVGFAVFTAPDDMGVPKPAFLATADYGSPENVEKIDALIQAALARGEKEGDLEFEHKDVDGRKLYTVDFSKMQAKAQAAEADEDMEDMDDMPMPQPSEMMKNMTKVHFVRDGNVMMFATDMNAMSDAMELNQGKGQPGGPTPEPPSDMQRCVDAFQ